MTKIRKYGAQCARGGLCRPFNSTGLAKLLGALLLLAAFSATVLAGNATLSWNRSTDPAVTGYNVYYGGASGAYTNVVNAGNATSATVSGLVPGTTYFIAATAYTASGVESLVSSEVAYTVPIPAGVQFRVMPNRQFVLTVTGPVGHIYDIMASPDLKTWTVIGTVQISGTGSLTFTDTNAANFPRRYYRTRG